MTSIAEAAAEFGVSRMTIYRWIAAGRLTKYERAGQRVRTLVDRRQIRKLLEPKAVRRA